MDVNFMDIIWQFFTQLLEGTSKLVDILFNTYDFLGVEVSLLGILGGVGLIALLIWSIVK